MSRGRRRPRPSSASCALCQLSRTTEAGTPRIGMCSFHASLNGFYSPSCSGVQTDSNGLKMMGGFCNCSPTRFALHPCDFLFFPSVQRHCNPEQLNATLTKPSAKCDFISQCFFLYQNQVSIEQIKLHYFWEILFYKGTFKQKCFHLLLNFKLIV